MGSAGFSVTSTVRSIASPHCWMSRASFSVPTVMRVFCDMRKSSSTIRSHISLVKSLISPIMIPMPRGTGSIYRDATRASRHMVSAGSRRPVASPRVRSDASLS